MYGFWMKPTIDMDTLMKAQEKTSCEGIELFYHNTTFLDDALELFDTIGEYNNR
jgi:hypothetical protein